MSFRQGLSCSIWPRIRPSVVPQSTPSPPGSGRRCHNRKFWPIPTARRQRRSRSVRLCYKKGPFVSSGQIARVKHLPPIAVRPWQVPEAMPHLVRAVLPAGARVWPNFLPAAVAPDRAPDRRQPRLSLCLQGHSDVHIEERPSNSRRGSSIQREHHARIRMARRPHEQSPQLCRARAALSCGSFSETPPANAPAIPRSLCALL